MLHAFTVDVEDYYQVSAFEHLVPRAKWSEYPSRVEANTRRMLEQLGRHNVSGTFFVLGWVGRQFPHLVREIHAAGHEVGSHSYWHRLVYEQTPDEFAADLIESRTVLEDAIGAPVTSYRAPSFSITQKSLWALDVLAQEGFTVDSSIYPVHHDRYGIPGAKREIHPLETSQGTLWEFPPSVRIIAGINVPVSGGGYFRLYPWNFTASAIEAAQRGGQPFMFYVHPWEIDPEQPRIPGAPLKSRLRHYVNLRSTEAKLERMLTRFSFGTVSSVIQASADLAVTARA